MDKTAALARIASFSGLPRPLLKKLAGLSGLQRIGKNTTLFREDERAQFIYALVEGSVLLCNSLQHEDAIAEFVEAGDVILIPPALLGLPYMVTAKAASDLLVVMIPADAFIRLSHSELAFSIALNRMLAGHWRLLLRHLVQTKAYGADARVIRYLMDNAGVTEGFACFSLPGSKRDLAAHLGITPETLSRSLKRISWLGVASRGSEIHIADVARLRAQLQQADLPPPGQAG